MTFGEERRQEIIDASKQHELVSVDGFYRFTSEDTERGESVWVHYRCGTEAWTAGVPRYKGEVRHYADLDVYVLSQDYDGKMPRAVLRGLSQSTVAALRQVLHASPSESVSSQHIDEDTRKEILLLMERDRMRVASRLVAK